MGRRIIFTVVNDLSYDQRMHRISSTLAEAGYDVTLFGRLLSSSASLPVLPYQTKRLKCIFNKGKLFYIEYNLRLFFYLLFHAYDIYGAVDLDTILPNLFAARIKGKKVTYDAHEYFTEVPEVHDRRLVKGIWKAVERFAVPRVDAACTVSHSLARIYEEEYRIKFRVIRNFPLRNSNPCAEEPGKYILYQGALNEGRGLEALIDAMPEIDMALVIAGEGDLSEALRQRVKKMGLEHKVQFKGFVLPSDLPELTAQAFAGYNVLEERGLSYYYSLSNKSNDYINSCVPVISSPFPEYKALAEEFEVFIFARPEKQEIVQAIRRLMESPSLYLRLRKNCGRAREKWNWENEKATLLMMYEEIS